MNKYILSHNIKMFGSGLSVFKSNMFVGYKTKNPLCDYCKETNALEQYYVQTRLITEINRPNTILCVLKNVMIISECTIDVITVDMEKI